jgi:hypothetical protein
VRAVDSSGADYVRAFDDPGAARELAGIYMREMESLIRSGVEVILPAGGLPALLFGDEVRTSAAPAVLVDSISIAIKACEMAVDLARFNGTGPSRLTTFSKPSDAAMAAIGMPR